MNTNTGTIFISCGESSGDLYASLLAKNLLDINPDLQIEGLGGDSLKNTGAKIVQHIGELQVIGAFEIIPKLLKIHSILSNLKKYLSLNKPSLAILIDFPDFNFILGKFFKKIHIPVVYYVSPQIWAWRYSRIYAMKKFVDLMIPLFQFEQEMYKKVGINTYFAGHPLLDIVHPKSSREDFIKKYNLKNYEFIFSILPGSRPSEIKYHNSVLLDACKKIVEQSSAIAFLIIKAPNIPISSLEVFKKIKAIILSEDKYNALYYSDLLLIASGTASIEACIAETPMIIFYKVNPLSWTLGRRLIKTQFLSMVNICAGEEVVPEYYQNLFKADKIADLSIKMIKSPHLRDKQVNKLKKIKESLGTQGASKKIAQFLINRFFTTYA